MNTTKNIAHVQIESTIKLYVFSCSIPYKFDIRRMFLYTYGNISDVPIPNTNIAAVLGDLEKLYPLLQVINKNMINTITGNARLIVYVINDQMIGII